MRIPTTTEFLALFVATGKFSAPSMQDAELSLGEAEPACDFWYTVRQGDICDSIAAAHRVPTYQIICENDAINGKCTNLGVGQRICVGRKGEDCYGSDTAAVQWPNTTPAQIAKQHGIPLDVFEENNYCYDTHHGEKCPQFHVSQTVCVAKSELPVELPKCGKIF